MKINTVHVCKSFPVLKLNKTVKLVKTFHRSTMTDERLTNLGIISIESETAKILDMIELIKTSASLKAKKK